MTKRTFATALAVFLTTALVVPSVFLIATPETYAQEEGAYGDSSGGSTSGGGVPTGEVPSSKITLQSVISAIKNTISAISDVANEASLKLLVVDKYVIQPLAFLLSGNLLKAMTSSVVSFVTGQSNGTGAPQFVQNVNGFMQQVGDTQASAFLSQLSRSPNSPFAASIASSLRTNYLQQTSAAGFFAANQSTLHQASPNVDAFLNGDWSQGGVRAWLALATQPQNNPYLLYQASQNQLSTLVGTAQSASRAQLDWGDGFLSWCGVSEASGTPDELGVDTGLTSSTNCIQADGSPGTIKTPGSVILATYSKAVGANQDKLVAAGNAGSELNSIMGSIATAMKSVNLASDLLGGAANTFGLAGAAHVSYGSSRNSMLGQYANTPGFIGATPSSVLQNAASIPSSGADTLALVRQYEASWNVIRPTVSSAAASVTDLASFCTAAANAADAALATGNPDKEYLREFATTSRAQAVAAQAAFTSEVVPAFAQVANASTTIAAARAMVQKVQDELRSTTASDATAYIADVKALQKMRPTATDVANAQQEEKLFNAATAVPPGSLNVLGGTIVDRMALLVRNATALKTSACVPPPPPPPPGSSAGGADDGSTSAGNYSLF